MEMTCLKQSCLKFRFGVFAIFVSAAAMALFSGCGKLIPKKNKDASKITTATTQIKLIDDAIQQYKLDVGSYPSDLQCLMQNLDQSDRWDGPYMKPNVPLDPWGFEYNYIYPGEHNRTEFDLFTYGADGQEGGKGVNADLNNWDSDSYSSGY